MGTVKTEQIASFNPVEMDGFSCPNCGSTEFTELVPYGGIWCSGCNAQYTFRDTCDGVNKVAISISTETCWYSKHKQFANYCTNIWFGDRPKDIHWLRFDQENNLSRV